MHKTKLTLFALLQLSTALILHPPVPLSVKGSLEPLGPAYVSWVAEPGDPERISVQIWNDKTLDTFEFVREVDVSEGGVVGILGDVPGDGFYLRAANTSNVLDVYARSEEFEVPGGILNRISSTVLNVLGGFFI